MKAVIGGIQSNLVNGVIWFNIKPNFFIFINDPNLEDTIRMRIKTRGIDMNSNSNDLAIQWRTIHELTKFPETSMKPMDKHTVENFEPRPFDSVIQPRLMNWIDLEIPRNWLLTDLVEPRRQSSTSNSVELKV